MERYCRNTVRRRRTYCSCSSPAAGSRNYHGRYRGRFLPPDHCADVPRIGDRVGEYFLPLLSGGKDYYAFLAVARLFGRYMCNAHIPAMLVTTEPSNNSVGSITYFMPYRSSIMVKQKPRSLAIFLIVGMY